MVYIPVSLRTIGYNVCIHPLHVLFSDVVYCSKKLIGDRSENIFPATLAMDAKEIGMYPPDRTWMWGANSCLIAMCPPAPV